MGGLLEFKQFLDKKNEDGIKTSLWITGVETTSYTHYMPMHTEKKFFQLDDGDIEYFRKKYLGTKLEDEKRKKIEEIEYAYKTIRIMDLEYTGIDVGGKFSTFKAYLNTRNVDYPAGRYWINGTPVVVDKVKGEDFAFNIQILTSDSCDKLMVKDVLGAELKTDG